MIFNFISAGRLVEASFVFLVLFALVGAFDGIYFHLIRFKLHLNANSRVEHLIHTLRAFLLGPMVYFLFAENSQGPALLLGTAFVIIDFGVEIADILVEKNSRENIGGISPHEYIVHVAATSFRTAAIVLLLLSKPVEAFSFNPTLLYSEPYPFFQTLFAKGFAFISIGGGIVSFALMPRVAAVRCSKSVPLGFQKAIGVHT